MLFQYNLNDAVPINILGIVCLCTLHCLVYSLSTPVPPLKNGAGRIMHSGLSVCE